MDGETLEKSFQNHECPVCAEYFGLEGIPFVRNPTGALVCHYRHSFKEDHDH